MKGLLRVLVFLAAWSPLPADAQEAPPVEVSFGYTYLTRADATLVQPLSGDILSPFFRGGDTPPANGWFADVGRNLTSHIGLVGHVSAAYVPGAMDTLWRRADNSAYTLLAGPRFTSPCCRRLVPFAQALAGLVRSSADYKPGPLTPADQQALATSSYHNTFGAFSLGGGVDVRLGGSVGVRVGADMMRTSRSPHGIDVQQTWRIRTGLIVPVR